MKRLFVALLLGLFGCAKPVIVVPPAKKMEVKPPLEGVMSAVGKYGLAHVCPTDRGVFTALHVANPYFNHIFGQEFQGAGAWEDGYGNQGIFILAEPSQSRDLARVDYSGEPVPYPIAEEEPEPGDKVYWKQFDYAEPDIMKTEDKESTVTHTLAGHIFVKDAPMPGASGGCLINDAGEAVGVVVWNIGQRRGGVVSISGDWKPTN